MFSLTVSTVLAPAVTILINDIDGSQWPQPIGTPLSISGGHDHCVIHITRQLLSGHPIISHQQLSQTNCHSKVPKIVHNCQHMISQSVTNNAWVKNILIQQHGKYFTLIPADKCWVLQIYFIHHQHHGQRSTFCLHLLFPPLHVFIRLPVCWGECQQAEVGAPGEKFKSLKLTFIVAINVKCAVICSANNWSLW